MKTILELNNIEAKDFFLKQESYCNFQLPEYFDFQQLLASLGNNKSLNGGIPLSTAKKQSNVNYKFFTNKDGMYSWRQFQLINPAIYVYLVNEITKNESWEYIRKRFVKFQSNPQIKCYSLPIVSEDEEKSDKAAGINNWWQQIEQQSIELSLQYECFLNTDITNCYSSIYTHSIVWALHGMNIVKQDIVNGNKRKGIGDVIDYTIQSMQYSQTNGIPEGSVLMDFIAEIVLGYADAILTRKIQRNEIENYQILRYRDDYRIFSDNEQTLQKIAKLLAETLAILNLKINSQKTFISTNIVKDAIKADKVYWNESKQGNKSLQKHLLLIHSLSEKYPNSGSLVIALDKFFDRVYPFKTLKEGSIKTLVGILIDIAYKNPRTYPLVIGILSKLFSLEDDENGIREMVGYIDKKFDKITNVGHLQVWMQRLTLKIEPRKEYREQMCKHVIDDNTLIWNIDWLPKTIQSVFSKNSIVNRNIIEKMPQIIKPEEIKIFNNNYQNFSI